jgi:spore photoproduct lyase
LAEGCPAHCQYCYLAGSLSGPPVTRVYANIEEILDGLSDYVGRGRGNASNLDMDEDSRAKKRTKFGSLKYVYPAELMKEVRKFFDKAIAEHLPNARILYWT